MSNQFQWDSEESDTYKVLQKAAATAAPFIPRSEKKTAGGNLGERQTQGKKNFNRRADLDLVNIERLPEFIEAGDLFAKTIFKHCRPDKSTVTVDECPILKKEVWFYKAPNTQIKGPFSTLTMFSWSSSGFLSAELLIGVSKDELVPLKDFRTVPNLVEEEKVEALEKADGVYEVKFVSKRFKEVTNIHN